MIALKTKIQLKVQAEKKKETAHYWVLSRQVLIHNDEGGTH